MWPKITDPILGTLYRGWGTWKGHCFVNEVELQLVIEIPKKINPQPFFDRVRFTITEFENLKHTFAQPLFEDYCFYKQTDMEAGGLSEADFQKHPTVHSAVDIWRVLKPYRLWHGSTVSSHLGNAYLLMDVDWPNPHFFQVFFLLEESSLKHMHTEFVG